MFEGFTTETIKFFQQLSRNNNREWFAKNKSRYEDVVLIPAINLVTDMEKPLKKISPHFTAVPRRSGGSLMRIYRDTRFSKDKTPYKTNLGVQFRHEAGKNVHAPGFYFHIDKDQIFVGAGIWHPDNPTLKKIRTRIVDDPSGWKRARNKVVKQKFELRGNSLKRPPRGFEADHPLIDDLKRKDFIGLMSLSPTDLYDRDLIDKLASRFKTSLPLVRFLCDALPLPC